MLHICKSMLKFSSNNFHIKLKLVCALFLDLKVMGSRVRMLGRQRRNRRMLNAS